MLTIALVNAGPKNLEYMFHGQIYTFPQHETVHVTPDAASHLLLHLKSQGLTIGGVNDGTSLTTIPEEAQAPDFNTCAYCRASFADRPRPVFSLRQHLSKCPEINARVEALGDTDEGPAL